MSVRRSPAVSRRGGTRGPGLGLFASAVICAVLGAAPAHAQDTLRVDTVQAPDSSRMADTLQVAGALPGMPDGMAPPEDTAVIRVLPPMDGARFDDDPARVAFWDAQALVRSRAITLLELLADLPGAVPLRTNDFGAPEGLVLAGRAGGRLRVFIDGTEETALDGSVPDLSHFSLGGLASVEVLRSGGETRILLETAQATDTVPLSTIEAGTGDLDTNIFRGTFLHPDAFGGGLGLVFERIDSEGVGDQGDGSLQNVWFRYLRPIGDRLTIQGDIRSRKTQSLLTRAPPDATRITRSLRIRGRIASWLTGEVYATENRIDLTADSTVADQPRNQHYGARLGWSTGPVRGRVEARYMDPAGRPNIVRTEADASISLPGLGGLSGRFGLDREQRGVNRVIWGVSGWTRPVLGISLYGSYDRGERGWFEPATLRIGPAPDSIAQRYPVRTDALYLRAGIRADLGPLQLDAAGLRNDVDFIFPLGNRVDQGVVPFPGDVVDGFEVSGSLALPLGGFRLQGSLQQWAEEGIYRPERIYRGGIAFQDTFYPTGNLEITASALVEGRDPMLVPIPDPSNGGPQRTPFYQSWNAFLQIRVVSVRIFVRWDNLFIRQNNQDIPGLLLPRTRAMYGVRWTLRN